MILVTSVLKKRFPDEPFHCCSPPPVVMGWGTASSNMVGPGEAWEVEPGKPTHSMFAWLLRSQPVWLLPTEDFAALKASSLM